eukprot:176236_1
MATNYNQFKNELIHYVSTHPLSYFIDTNETKENKSLSHELCKIIVSYLYCIEQISLIFDFSHATSVNQNDKINCIAKYPSDDEYDQFRSSIWVTINNQILTYHPHNNSLSQKLHSISESIPSNKEYLNLLTMENIKQIFITHFYRIFVIANNGYLHQNILLGSNWVHWQQFMPINRGRDCKTPFGGGKCHYITCELLSILNLLWIGSACEVVLNKSETESIVIKLYEYDDSNWAYDIHNNQNTFKEIINIDQENQGY